MGARSPAQPRADLVELGDGRWARLLSVLGRGASSVVHRALLEAPNGMRRLVALKLFGSVGTDDEELLELLASVARRSAAVRHPNIVEVHDFGQAGKRPFFVTELVEGVSLHTLLERYSATARRCPLDLSLFIGTEVADALSAARTARDAHDAAAGMLHLALGPRKILLGFCGEVKVCDFETSLASAAASSSVRSFRSVVHRTRTMAPEVAMGDRGDARSDVFSLGIVLRELLVGPRFASDVTNNEAVRLAREGFVLPMSFQPHLPEALVAVLTRALENDPRHRFPNASVLAFDLRRIALAMGVGDGRIFLRRALDLEWGRGDEITQEQPAP